MPALGQLRNDSFMSPFDIIKDRDRVRKTVFYFLTERLSFTVKKIPHRINVKQLLKKLYEMLCMKKQNRFLKNGKALLSSNPHHIK